MTLEGDLRNKIKGYVQHYVDDNNLSGRTGPLSRIKLFSYIQERDQSLKRRRNAQLDKILESVICDMEAQHLQSNQTTKPIEIDDEEVEIGEPQLDRSINQSLTNGWNIAPASIKEPAIESIPKRKERPVNKEPKAKRARVEENRDPPKDISLADLGGVEACIAEVKEMIVMPLTHPEVYTHLGVPTPRGVLLHGPPGCGKTLLANAVAGEIGLPFIPISAPELVSGMSGESEKKVRELFDQAKQLAPCLIFIDEIDAVTPKRENAQREMERRIVAQLLTCMDDLALEKTDGKPVLIIGATNRPDSLDSALRRAGRFDREICMGVPDERSREQILSVLSRKLTLSGDIDLKKLAKMTPGFVGADLNALTAAAGVIAIKRIFHALQEKADFLRAAEPAKDLLEIDSMEVDTNIPIDGAAVAGESTTATVVSSRLVAIRDFLSAHPERLSDEDLSHLAITYKDFLDALPQIQPSSKREGFTTVPDVTWTDIGALRSIRTELQMAIVQPIKRPEIYKSVGIVAPAGVLLWGPPGCGKTLLAKAVANESRANFISVRGPELLNKYVGESERAVRQVFLRARASAPCVIFFDELDALVPRRDDSLSESSARVVNTLLTELDGLGDRNGVFVIAATNRPDMIDPAMMRPGRLDKPLFVQLPSEQEREEILKTLTKKNPIDPSCDFGLIARDTQCENFSGADLAALVREAAVAALKAAVFHDILDAEPDDGIETVTDKILITQQNFMDAFDKVKPSVTESQRMKYDKLLKKLT